MVRLFLLMGMMLFLGLPLAVQASPQLVDQSPLENEVDEARARDLMSGLRCLVCQNQSIEDSNADLALTLRLIVREQVKAGKTDEEIKSYLVARYGEWVLMRPPLNARTYLLWGGPLFILILGGVGLFLRSRKNAITSPKKSTSLSEKEQTELDTLLAKSENEEGQE